MNHIGENLPKVKILEQKMWFLKNNNILYSKEPQILRQISVPSFEREREGKYEISVEHIKVS